MHEKALPKGSKQLLDKLESAPPPALQGWVLAGGTALALRRGHRISEDFDFFRTDAMDLAGLHGMFRSMGSYETLQEAEHTLTVLTGGVKISFFCIPDPFLFPPTPYRFFAVADIRDLALMKVIAISGRGSRRDFIDLYTILRAEWSLRDCLEFLPRKYGAGRVNAYHLLKSLTYFKDAEKEPMPRMLEPFDWKECKGFFTREAHSLVLPPGL